MLNYQRVDVIVRFSPDDMRCVASFPLSPIYQIYQINLIIEDVYHPLLCQKTEPRKKNIPWHLSASFWRPADHVWSDDLSLAVQVIYPLHPSTAKEKNARRSYIMIHITYIYIYIIYIYIHIIYIYTYNIYIYIYYQKMFPQIIR